MTEIIIVNLKVNIIYEDDSGNYTEIYFKL